MRSRASVIWAMVFAVAIPTTAAANSEVDALRERATAYWEAKTLRSEAVFDFYAPPEKGGPDRDAIYEGKQARLDSAVVDTVEVTDGTGIVHVKLEIASFEFLSPAMAMALEQHPELRHRTIRDEWLQVDGTWYRKPRVPFGGRFHKNKLTPTDGASHESSGVGGK